MSYPATIPGIYPDQALDHAYHAPMIQRFLYAWMRRHQRLRAGLPLLDNLELVNDLCLDSIDRVELIIDLEASYHITIPDAEIDQLLTILDVEACVQRQLCAAFAL